MTVKRQLKERDIERHLVKQAGRHNILCYKFTSPSNNGVPDRLLIGHGQTIFVEVKRPGEKVRPLQQVVINDMIKHGATVHIVDTKKGVDALIHSICHP